MLWYDLNSLAIRVSFNVEEEDPVPAPKNQGQVMYFHFTVFAIPVSADAYFLICSQTFMALADIWNCAWYISPHSTNSYK